MSKFSRWTPTLGVCFKWDSQKVLKIAHFGVFRHIGGTWGVQKHMYLKIYWVKVISSKNGDFWTPQCWEINFFRQNIGMFDWLYTETYVHCGIIHIASFPSQEMRSTTVQPGGNWLSQCQKIPSFLHQHICLASCLFSTWDRVTKHYNHNRKKKTFV